MSLNLTVAKLDPKCDRMSDLTFQIILSLIFSNIKDTESRLKIYLS